jgi:hypothetical protein
MSTGVGQGYQGGMMAAQLEDAIRAELTVLFSDKSMLEDRLLMRRLRNNVVPFDYLCCHPRLRKLTADRHVILHVARTCPFLFVGRDGKKLGRKDHLPALVELAYRMVELVHLPANSNVASVRAMVEPFGSVVHVDVFSDEDEGARQQGGPKVMQALVEFGDQEAALQVRRSMEEKGTGPLCTCEE